MERRLFLAREQVLTWVHLYESRVVEEYQLEQLKCKTFTALSVKKVSNRSYSRMNDKRYGL